MAHRPICGKPWAWSTEGSEPSLSLWKMKRWWLSLTSFYLTCLCTALVIYFWFWYPYHCLQKKYLPCLQYLASGQSCCLNPVINCTQVKSELMKSWKRHLLKMKPHSSTKASMVYLNGFVKSIYKGNKREQEVRPWGWCRTHEWWLPRIPKVWIQFIYFLNSVHC